jgi:hypothetical protein
MMAVSEPKDMYIILTKSDDWKPWVAQVRNKANNYVWGSMGVYRS